jgi:SHAQKYF class myb-like DNA-binding protein
MSTLSPVADPTASMSLEADDIPDVELPGSMTKMTSVPDPTGGSALNLLETVNSGPEVQSQFAGPVVNVAVTTTAAAAGSPSTDMASTAAAVSAPTSTSTDGKPAASSSSSSSSSSSKRKKVPHPVTVQMATAATAALNGQGNQGENTGRWTAEEHQLFLQGLEIHGKGWKKIAGLIKSRTVVQIRTHAQKYFQKLAKAKQNGEEGEVMMEGRGVPVSVAASMPASASSGAGAQANKRRKHSATGTKRKAISSVVASAQRQAKKSAASRNGGRPMAARQTLPVAPVLAPYVLPQRDVSQDGGAVPSITTAQGTISGPALEDSL